MRGYGSLIIINPSDVAENRPEICLGFGIKSVNLESNIFPP